MEKDFRSFRGIKQLKIECYRLLIALENYEEKVICSPETCLENIPGARQTIIESFWSIKDSLMEINKQFAGYNDAKTPVDFEDMEF